MRKSGWAVAAAGLFSVALLLSACGGGSSGSPTGGSSTASGNTQATTTPGSQPGTGSHSSGGMQAPPAGAKYFSIQKASHNGKPTGFVLVYGAGDVVYTFAGDTKGQAGTCTGGCAALWPPLTGVALKSTADSLPGTFGTTSTGQLTYDGWPLYGFKGEHAHVSHAGGQWKDIPMSCSNIVGGCPQ